MAFVNKLVIACTGEAPVTYDINQTAESVLTISAVLSTIPSGLGTYTYSYAESTSGNPSITLNITGATCDVFFYVDGIPYSATLDGGSGQYVIGEGTYPLFNLEYSVASDEFTVPICCENCNKPIFVSELYEGDTYIPFYLDMEDGAVVNLDGTTANAVIFSQKGLLESPTPLVKGQSISLKVYGCDTYSDTHIVKSRPEDCDFITPTPCYIKVLDIQVETVDLLFGRIKSLNVASYGDLKYRINNGEWYDSWTSLGKFPLNSGVTLYIKSKANPSCRIEYPMLVIQKYA